MPSTLAPDASSLGIPHRSKVFSTNSKDSLLLELHPNARMILGGKNIAFAHGPDHKNLRKSFLPLFTRRALSTYVIKQDTIIRYLGFRVFAEGPSAINLHFRFSERPHRQVLHCMRIEAVGSAIAMSVSSTNLLGML